MRTNSSPRQLEMVFGPLEIRVLESLWSRDSAGCVRDIHPQFPGVELAALLLKVVRLAPLPLWNSAIVSPFVERDGLDRRVRRLLRPDLEPPAPLAIVPIVAVTTIGVAGLAALSSAVALELIFEAFERLVAFGR